MSRGVVKTKRIIVVPAEPAVAAAASERASEEDASDTVVRFC